MLHFISAYATTSDYNVVTVDWSPISKCEFVITSFRVPRVGSVIGKLVNQLLRLRLTTSDRVHLIGHSLGSHVVGTAASYITQTGNKKVARVTGE